MLAYLGRYTHRVAIANSRLVSLANAEVAFRWKDYRHHGKTKLMTLAADEFIWRFLLHTLPDGFHRIRHYGFLANRQRAAKTRALSSCSTRHRRNRPPNRSRMPSRRIGPIAARPAVGPWSCSVSWRARRPVAHPSGMIPRDALAIRQHCSSATGRRLRPQGLFRSPTKML